MALLSDARPSYTPAPSPDIDFAPTGLHKGLPAIYFNKMQTQQLTTSFEWTLVGKFSYGYNKENPKLGRPAVEHMEQYFIALDLKGKFRLGLLDNRHLLIQCQLKEDFLRLYSRSVWYISGHPMRIFKWSPGFHTAKESSVVPVWLAFPRLPVHLFQKSALFQIASLIGFPLRTDVATAEWRRPSIARIQVEIDLLKVNPTKLWIGMEGFEGFWQKVEYENMPSYCTHCWHVGRSEQLCHVHHPELKTGTAEHPPVDKSQRLKQVYKPKVPEQQKSQPSVQPDVPSGLVTAAADAHKDLPPTNFPDKENSVEFDLIWDQRSLLKSPLCRRKRLRL